MSNKIKNVTLGAAVALLAGVSAASCNPLTPEAKEMAGVYYNMELSETEPVMELNSDGTCVMHAIRPGVLSYSVGGTWNVKRDTLFVVNETEPFNAIGDTTLIGDVAPEISRPVVNFNGFTLTLRSGDTEYIYTRRGVANNE